MQTTIIDLVRKYGVVLKRADGDDRDSKNNCYVTGNEILMGEYDDDELLLISFFHEVGHRMVTQRFKKKWNYNTLIIELECWRLGIEEARTNGIIFSDEAIGFGYKRALTYVGHDKRERRTNQQRSFYESTTKG